jgi:hypothetical protein
VDFLMNVQLFVSSNSFLGQENGRGRYSED